MADLYDTLGVAKDATKAAIKSAFRRKAKDAHPDTGGSAEKFHALEKAHRILTSDELRERYDRTGNTDTEPDNTEGEAIAIIAGIVDRFIQDDKAIYKDLVAEIRKSVNQDIAKARETIKEAKDYAAKTEKLKKRVRGKRGAALLSRMFEDKGKTAKQAVDVLEKQIKVREIAIKLMEDTSFDVEKMSPISDDYYQRAADRLNAAQSQMWRNIYGSSTT